MRMRTLMLLAGGIALVACTGTTRSWISTPLKQTAENPYVHVEFIPQKNMQLYYDSFLIVISNKTPQPLEVDWNQTRYLLNGKAYGNFGFEGLTKDNINDLPSDTIPPQETLSKNIFPINLIAWKPYKSEFKDSPAFSAGPVPEGTSGISLAFRRGDRLRRITLAVSIQVEIKQ